MSERDERRPRLAILISGSGTNLQALLDAMEEGRLRAEPAVVVSNRREAYGLERAAGAGVPTVYFPFKSYRPLGRPAYDAALARVVRAFAPDLIVLAGWMHILTPAFLNEFPGRVINLHPALPGQFAGVNAIERAYEAFQAGQINASGCMVHYAVPEVDAGPVVASVEVPIFPGEALADFAGRLHAAEHRLIVEATAIALDRLPGPLN